jgi:RHS repeat-associated protein
MNLALKSILLFSLLTISIVLRAQIYGQNPVLVGTTNVYTYTSSSPLNATWQVSSHGTIVSISQAGIAYQITIRWNIGGTGTITFMDAGITKATLSVTISTVPLPPSVASVVRCGPGSVNLSGTPGQGGNTIRWYTTLTGGTHIAVGTTFTTPSISTTTKFYATTFNTSTLSESASRTECSATIQSQPAAPTITGNVRIGPGELILTATGGKNYLWYSAANELLSSSLTYKTPTISSSTSNYLYARTQGDNNCISPTVAWVNITILPRPAVVVSNKHIVMGQAVTLEANAGYATYVWMDSASNIVGNSRILKTNLANRYTVTVTKSAVDGTGTSLPIVVLNQLDAQSRNFIVTNTMRFPTTDKSRLTQVGADSMTQSVRYFDGLGQKRQEIATQASPLRNDIVTPYSVDEYGRECKKYLPYADGNDGRFKENALKAVNVSESLSELDQYRTGKQYAFYQQGGNIPIDPFPYAETIFESNALNRVVQQGFPGTVWQPNTASTIQSPVTSSKAIIMAYELNGANEVLKFKCVLSADSPIGLIDVGTATSPAYYEPYKLFKHRTKDENRNETITYTDTDGNVVLKRVQAGAASPINDVNYASTYYIYDDFRQLVCVIPPEATKLLFTKYMQMGSTSATKESFLATWAFRYQYDDLRRMVQKQAPGAKPVYMVYDGRNRLVLTQDGNQRALSPQEWTFTKYDAFNRAILKGKYRDSRTLAEVQVAVDNFYLSNAPYETYLGSAANNVLGYSNLSFPQVSAPDDFYNVTFYDKHDAYIAPPEYAYYFESLPGQESAVAVSQVNKMSLITATLKKDLSTGTWLRTVNYYDARKRPIQSIEDHHRNGKIRTTSVFNFPGNITCIQKTYTIDGTVTVVKESYLYDHLGRTVSVRHRINNSPEIVVSTKVYNALGQLIDQKLHSTDNGASFKQSIDYKYHIRGWLTNINDVELNGTPDADALGDFFGMQMHYQDALSSFSAPALYNSSISALQWSKSGGGSGKRQGYGVLYDKLGRMVAAKHFDGERDLITKIFKWNSNNNQFGEAVAYDHNSNIKSVVRLGSSGAEIDKLTYQYTGNQLNYVNDASALQKGFLNGNTGADDYSYDDNGNLDKDKNKGIAVKGAIKYNFLNLPTEVIKGQETVKYTYDSNGKKLSQQVYNASGVLVKVTDYVDKLVLEGATPTTTLKMIQHAEGRAFPDGNGWEYQYFLKDHLGNVRVCFTGKNQAQKNFIANFEATTNNNFLNYSRHIWDLVDHTDAGNLYQSTQYLNGSVQGRVGVAKTFTVMPGDEISARAYVKYMNLTTTLNSNALIGSLASAFGVSSSSTGEQLKAYNALNAFAGLVPEGNHHNDDDAVPKIFVTILFFDNDYKLLDAAWDQVSTVGSQTSGSVKQPPHDLLSVTAKAPDVGYAYVFVSNEHSSYVDAYFDDVTFGYKPSPIVSVDDYYPFGMVYNHAERELSVPQKNLYNGKEFQDALSLNWYDYGARMYMSDIGRWGVLDNLSENYESTSSYAYALNDPMNAIDPDGNLVIFVGGFMLDQYLNQDDQRRIMSGAINIQDNNHPYPGPRTFSRDAPTYLGTPFIYGWGNEIINGEGDITAGVGGLFSRIYDDYNTVFISATADRDSQAEDRFAEGEVAAADLIKQLDQGKITLADDETIKIIGHSQGAAFAAGMVSVLAKHEKYSKKLEVIHYLSPHQPGAIRHAANVLGYQWSTHSDLVSSVVVGNLAMQLANGGSSFAQIKGIKEENFKERKFFKGGRGGHTAWTWYRDIVKWAEKNNITVTVH